VNPRQLFKKISTSNSNDVALDNNRPNKLSKNDAAKRVPRSKGRTANTPTWQAIWANGLVTGFGASLLVLWIWNSQAKADKAASDLKVQEMARTSPAPLPATLQARVEPLVSAPTITTGTVGDIGGAKPAAIQVGNNDGSGPVPTAFRATTPLPPDTVLPIPSLAPASQKVSKSETSNLRIKDPGAAQETPGDVVFYPPNNTIETKPQ
jgi:hypothetical protein